VLALLLEELLEAGRLLEGGEARGMEPPLAPAAGEVAPATRGRDRRGRADEAADEERAQSPGPVVLRHGTIVGMKETPDALDGSAIVAALRRCWDFEAGHDPVYAAVGAGSYHWIVADPSGRRGFVTVDDLGQKVWLGDTWEETFSGLRRALDTAVALRAHGLDFVVAPSATRTGESVHRLDRRYSIALFPFVEGSVSTRGRYDDDKERAGVVALLAELHRATSALGAVASASGLELPGRRRIERALDEQDVPWTGGPFSEPARMAVRAAASDLLGLLTRADRLAREADGNERRWVLTHGEPHAANVIWTSDGLRLVDWDTVALAPPERDLWMLVSDAPDLADAYRSATGTQLDPMAVDFYRLSWDLRDLAEYITVLRSPHEENDDTARAYEALTRCTAIKASGGGLRA
jgi:spectinomycin phosphotransferase